MKMGLLRYQVFLSYGILFFSVWYYCLQVDDFGLPPLLVKFAPIWALLALGLSLLFRLFLGVVTYQDCPEAAVEIERQILEAKAEMKKRKIIQ